MSRSPELILVVDDDASIRAAMRELLETEGYDVTEAANGLAALGKLRAGLRPAVILLDLMMPVMDGWDLRTEQLRDPELAAIPVLIVTAAGFSLESVTAQFGSIGFVPKPPAPELLLEEVRKLCRPPEEGALPA
jgi:CheY-like chemotaxis protein